MRNLIKSSLPSKETSKSSKEQNSTREKETKIDEGNYVLLSDIPSYAGHILFVRFDECVLIINIRIFAELNLS